METGRHLVVVVAHPDDETFSCGSAIAAASAGGATVTVLCATRGEAGERRPHAATDHLPLAEVREAELRDAAETLGVSAVELLGYADSDFAGPMPDGALCSVPLPELTAVLTERFAELAPDMVLTLDGSDGHRDHLHVRAATEAALAAGDRPVLLRLSCLANSLMRRWVDEMRATGSGTAYLDLDVSTLGTPDELLTAHDVGHVLEVREAAIACHRSQRSPFEDLSPGLRREFLATDHVIDTVLGGTG